MRIDTQSGQYSISFGYKDEECGEQPKKSTRTNGEPKTEPIYRRVTQCWIFRVGDDGKRLETPIGYGEAKCDSRDQFAKACGRRKAMKKALRLAGKNGAKDNDRVKIIERYRVVTADVLTPDFIRSQPKADRKRLWHRYLEKTGELTKDQIRRIKVA